MTSFHLICRLVPDPPRGWLGGEVSARQDEAGEVLGNDVPVYEQYRGNTALVDGAEIRHARDTVAEMGEENEGGRGEVPRVRQGARIVNEDVAGRVGDPAVRLFR